MAHEIAKLMLEHAGTFLERAEAVKMALFVGMPLRDIEEYLDWLEIVRSQKGEQEPAQDGQAARKGEHAGD